jgi:hypothetical protein
MKVQRDRLKLLLQADFVSFVVTVIQNGRRAEESSDGQRFFAPLRLASRIQWPWTNLSQRLLHDRVK